MVEREEWKRWKNGERNENSLREKVRWTADRAKMEERRIPKRGGGVGGMTDWCVFV